MIDRHTNGQTTQSNMLSGTRSSAPSEVNTKAASVEAKTTDTDPAFTLGASVLVGGVKSGRLRYIGGVHFVAGQWCGIELDDADGLHDGTVDGVRYFTCLDGHGIFAPRHRVTLRPHSRSSGSPDVRLRALRKPTANVPCVSAEDGDAYPRLHVNSTRHRHQSSLDGRDLDFSTSLKLGADRPQSARLTDDDPDATSDSTRKRSSLVSGRLVASSTARASPKRVTFFDEIISSKERGVPCMKTDVQATNRGHNSVEGHSTVVNSDVRTDTRTIVTPANDFIEGLSSRKMPRTVSHRAPGAQRSYVDSDLDNLQLDLEISNRLTADQELSLSSDSIEANEIDNDFAEYGLASVARSRLGDEQSGTPQTSASKSPKTRVDEALSDLELIAGHQQEPALSFSDKPSSSGTSPSLATRASFELARTALTQYADLVRAAEESIAVRRTWTPPAGRRSLPVPPTAGQCAFALDPATPPAKDPTRSPEPTTLQDGGGSSSCSADDVEFETFDGEELDSIGDAMIDSIDGSSEQSEDSISMLPHLSDVDDDDVVDSVNQTTSVKDSVTTSDDQNNGNDVNYDERTVSVSNNINVDISLLNELNDAVTCRQLAFSQTLQTCSGPEESLIVIADSQAVTITTGIATDIDYFLRQSTTFRDERPMSLISNSSSTDTGQ